MRRNVLMLVGVALLMVGRWSAGHAQTRMAAFEVTIETPRGPVKVTCSGGCDWPANDGTLSCDRERCDFRFNEHGRILVGQPRGQVIR